MNEKLVLPRFDVPRDSTQTAMRVLWAMGGVVVLATLIFGLAMWHHRSLEVANAEQAAARAAAARRAAMPPPIAAPAIKVGDKTADTGSRAGAATTLATVATSAAPGDVAPAAAPVARPRRSVKSGGRSRALARAATATLDPGDKSPKVQKSEGRKSKSNDDVIDRLLNQYKK